MRPSAPRRIPLPSYPAGCLAKLAGCLAKLLRARQQAEAGSWRPVHDYMEPPGSPELEEAYKLYVSEPDVSNGRRTLGSGLSRRGSARRLAGRERRRLALCEQSVQARRTAGR